MYDGSFVFSLFLAEAFARGYVSKEKPLKVGVEFSLVEPQGGIHFVVPENPLKHRTEGGNGSGSQPPGSSSTGTSEGGAGGSSEGGTGSDTTYVPTMSER